MNFSFNFDFFDDDGIIYPQNTNENEGEELLEGLDGSEAAGSWSPENERLLQMAGADWPGTCPLPYSQAESLYPLTDSFQDINGISSLFESIPDQTFDQLFLMDPTCPMLGMVSSAQIPLVSEENTTAEISTIHDMEITDNPDQSCNRTVTSESLHDSTSRPRKIRRLLPAAPETTPSLDTVSIVKPLGLSSAEPLSRLKRHRKPKSAVSRAQKYMKCIPCLYVHKGCDKTEIDEPCYRCRERYSEVLQYQPCTKAQFLDIIEAGPYFPSVYELWMTNVEAESTLKYLNEIQESRQSIGCSTLSLNIGSISCDIPVVLVSEIMESIISNASTNNTDRTRQPFASNVCPGIARLVKLQPAGSAISLTEGVSGTSSKNWRAILHFCKEISFELLANSFSIPCISPQSPTLDQTSNSSAAYSEEVNQIITDCISWTIIRYLEICLFKQLQSFVNAPNQGKSLIKSHIKLMFHILVLHEDMFANFKKLKNTFDDLQNAQLEVELVDRRNRISMALWMYISILKDKVLPFDALWDELTTSYPLLHLVKPFKKSFITSHEAFFSSRQTFCRQLDRKVYHFQDLRNATKRSLRTTPLQANNSPQSTLSSKPYGFLRIDDLLFYCAKRQCPTGWANKWQSSLCGRIFLGLGNISFDNMLQANFFGASTVQVQEIFRRHILVELQNRQFLISQYELSEMIASQVPANISDVTGLIPVIIGQGFADTDVESTYRDCIRLGRRWKQLTTLYGDAILLCGSPFVDHSECPDIPTIIATGNEEDFEHLIRGLQSDFPWLQKICNELKEIPSLMPRGIKSQRLTTLPNRVVALVSSVIEAYPPAYVYAGDFLEYHTANSFQNLCDYLFRLDDQEIHALERILSAYSNAYTGLMMHSDNMHTSKEAFPSYIVEQLASQLGGSDVLEPADDLMRLFCSYLNN